LDIDSRDALVQALNEYEGAVLIISHDRHLIEATVDQLWIAENGTISVCDYDLDTYQRSIVGNKSDKSDEVKDNSPADKKKERQRTAALRAELAPLRKEIKALETKVEKLNQQLQKIDKQLEDPDLFQKDQAKAVQLGKDRSDTLEKIELAETDWMTKVDELEQAEAAQAQG
jgi:ATP-binding cassette subfamily F protein 3